jgi:hypothetical protein
MEQRDILQHHESVVLKDTKLLRIVEVCHAAPFCWRMPRCSVVLKKATVLVVLKDARLLRGVAPQSSVASFNTTEQCGILQHHGAAWHPPTPRSSVASFTTTEHYVCLQHHAW